MSQNKSRHDQTPDKGFAGILMTLLTAVVIFFWAYYYSPLAPSQKNTDAPTRSVGLDAIDDAKNVKALIESRDSTLMNTQ